MRGLVLALAVFLAVGGACRPEATSPLTGAAMDCSEPKGGVATCTDGVRVYRCVTDLTGCNARSCGAYTELNQ